jgi:hypothetical protein
MTFLFFLIFLVLAIYGFLTLVAFLRLANKLPLPKKEQELLLNKIRTSNILFTNGGGGTIPAGNYQMWSINFSRSPFFFTYEFGSLGWVPWYSPVTKEVNKRFQEYKIQERTYALKKYGIMENDQ